MNKKNKMTILAAVIASMSQLASAIEIEEVIVTATKRAESIKDVPVSVATINSEQMSAMGVVNMRDASAFIPNFEFSNDPILPNLYIRGLGAGISQIIEQSIGTFNDGVYMGRATASSVGFMDVSNLEVLRGTQGTLFGKNTVAGALVVSTNNPTDTFEAGITGVIGDYSTTGNYHEVEGYISGPLTDRVNGRLAMRYSDSDGYVENRLDGPNGAAREDFSIRGKLAWTVGDNTDFNLKLEAGEYETEGQVSMEILGFDRDRNPARHDLYTSASPGFEDTLNWQGDLDCSVEEAMNFCPGREQKYHSATLKIEHDLGFATLTSITGYQAYDYHDQFVSIDVGIVGGAFQATRIEDYSSISEEIRLTSEAGPDNPFDYIVGLYLDKVELQRDQGDHFNIGLIGGPAHLKWDRHEDWTLDTETAAVFGQARWHFSENMTLSLGGRYSREDKTYDFIRKYNEYYSDEPRASEAFPVQDAPEASRSENKFTPSGSLEWAVNEEVNVYYTYAQGHKTGGFSDRLGAPDAATGNLANVEFDAETSTMHEVGMKGLFFDGRLDFNINLFHMAMADLQVARVGNPDECGAGAFCFVVQNAAEVTSKGIETDWRFYATDTITLGGAYAYTDASYDSFEQAGCKIGVGGTCDISGETMIFAPEHKGNVYAQYRKSLDGGWEMAALLNVSFSSEYYGSQELDEEVKQDAYELVNASVQFTSPNNVKFSLIGRNLTEEAVLSFGIPVPGGQPYAFGSSAAPRELALSVNYEF